MIADVASSFSPLDVLALALLAFAWAASGWVIENPPASRPSVSVLMERYRGDWMVEMITREPRIFDATILASLRQGTTFMASAAMIAVGGVLALAGNAERIDDLAMDVGEIGHPVLFWQAKLAVVAMLLTHAVFKFIWSNRLFGYCAVLMASVPNDVTDPRTKPRAAKAGELNERAAANFNRGLRSVYFAFAALGWLIGAAGLLVAVVAVSWVVLGREFTSQSRGILTED